MRVFLGAYEAPYIEDTAETIVWNLERIRSKDYLAPSYRFSCVLDMFTPSDYTSKVMVF